jgi:L-malate glycosyltransferase
LLVPKILIFAHDASLYGASQSLLTLLEAFKKNNSFEMLVLLPNAGAMEEKLQGIVVNYQVINFPRCFSSDKSKHIFNKLNNTLAYNRKVKLVWPELVNIVTAFKPNLIYTNTSIVSIGHLLSTTYNIPHVWHVREFGDLDYDFKYIPSRKNIVGQMKKSERLIFVSQALRKHWLGDKIGAKTEVIYNGIFDEKYSALKKNEKGETFNFGILGALLPGKGQDLAINAMATLAKTNPNVRLHLYGNIIDKAYHRHLLKLIEEHKLKDNVLFKAFENDADLIYSNLDVLLNCSLMEGFGRTIVEAMSHQIPVIANATGGPLEIIDDKVNGLLFHSTSESLASNMLSLLSDENLRATISKNGKEKALQQYSVKLYSDKVYGIIHDALNNVKQ